MDKEQTVKTAYEVCLKICDDKSLLEKQQIKKCCGDCGVYVAVVVEYMLR